MTDIICPSTDDESDGTSLVCPVVWVTSVISSKCIHCEVGGKYRSPTAGHHSWTEDGHTTQIPLKIGVYLLGKCIIIRIILKCQNQNMSTWQCQGALKKILLQRGLELPCLLSRNKSQLVRNSHRFGATGSDPSYTGSERQRIQTARLQPRPV